MRVSVTILAALALAAVISVAATGSADAAPPDGQRDITNNAPFPGQRLRIHVGSPRRLH